MSPYARWLRPLGFACRLAVLLSLTCLGSGTSGAGDQRIPSGITSAHVSEAKRTMSGLYVSALDAHGLLGRHKDILLVDVRSIEQVNKDGVAAGTHKVVPFLVASADHAKETGSAAFDRAPMRINPFFLEQLERLTGGGSEGKTRTILVICPDGSQSALAVDHLADNGYSRVYLIVDGIGGRAGSGADGWRAQGLPWQTVPTAAQLD